MQERFKIARAAICDLIPLLAVVLTFYGGSSQAKADPMAEQLTITGTGRNYATAANQHCLVACMHARHCRLLWTKQSRGQAAGRTLGRKVQWLPDSQEHPPGRRGRPRCSSEQQAGHSTGLGRPSRVPAVAAGLPAGTSSPATSRLPRAMQQKQHFQPTSICDGWWHSPRQLCETGARHRQNSCYLACTAQGRSHVPPSRQGAPGPCSKAQVV